MITVELKNFFETGEFGPIHLGMSIDKVVDILGEPEGITEYNNGHAEIIYAYYEFIYLTKTKTLYGIQNYHLATFPNLRTGRVNNKKDIFFKNDNFIIDIWFLKKNRFLTLDRVIDNLVSEKLDFSLTRDFKENVSIEIKNGAVINFDNLSGSTFYDKKNNSWTPSEVISKVGKQILSGVGFHDLSLT